MATLTGQTKAATYGNLLQIPNSNNGIDTTLRTLQDGKGNSLPFALSTTRFDFSVSPSAPQNTSSERFGLGATAVTFAECSLFGQNAISGMRASVVLGYGAYSQLNDYSFSDGDFGGAPTIIGTQAFGSGTSLGYKAESIGREAISIGPKSIARGLAVMAIGDGARGIPTGPNGNQIVMGDAVYAKGNVNWILGGGSGVEHDFVMSLGGAGGSTSYNLNQSTANHQGLLGWYQHDHTLFSAGQGLFNDWWLGGPQVASVPHAITLNITSRLGSNLAGVDFTINASRATGNAAGGAIDFQTSVVGSSGATLQSYASKLKLNGVGVGFFGVTPVARAVVPTGSTTDQVITALQNLGLISQS